MSPSFSLLSWARVLVVFLILFHLNSSFGQSEDYGDDSSSKIHFSGEAGLAYFDTGSDGEFPNGEFRVDEGKLFVEAAIMQDIYIFGELNLITREEESEFFQLGELYAEFDSISKLWGKDDLLNIRFGRFDIPFGEEYLTRDAIDNPFVSHSLSDIWGVDEGIELYGFTKHFEYVFAVQNGGDPLIRDFNSDKAIIGRIQFKWRPKMHLSFSAMRTGDIDVQQDKFSQVWFANGELRALGSEDTTSTFHADLIQVDGHAGWSQGHFHANAGHLRYRDNDTSGDNSRDVSYFQIEGVQNFYGKQDIWYVGERFSQIISNEGFPLVGNGKMERFLFDDNLLTKRLWRFNIGIGYRIGRNVLVKAEYNFERGKLVNGTKRDAEDFFGIETALKF